MNQTSTPAGIPPKPLFTRLPCVARGLGCYPSGGTVDGISGDHILLAPPYIITPAEIGIAVDRLGAAIDDALSSVSHNALSTTAVVALA